MRRRVGWDKGVQSSPINWTERYGNTPWVEKRVDRKGRRIICTELCIFIPSAFTGRHNIGDVRSRFFFTLAARQRHVSDTRIASIHVWRFDICLDYPAEVDDNIATNGPAGCAITACLDGNGEGVVLTKDDNSGSGSAVLEVDTRVPDVCSRLTG